MAGRWVRPVGLDGAAALLVGVVAVAVLRTTLLPGVSMWDTGEAQVAPAVLGTMHSPGFPAYVVLGWLTTILLRPLGSPAFLMNLLSAILVAVAAGGLVLVTRRLGAPLGIAVAVAAGFVSTPIVWEIGVAADVHALHLALVVLVVLGLVGWESLVRRRVSEPDDPALAGRADRVLVVTAAVFGIAVANHALSLLLIPAIGLYVLVVDARVLRRPRLVAAALGTSVAVAALLYLELPLRAGLFRAPLVYGHPETWNGFWDIVLARQFQGAINVPLSDLGAKAQALLVLADRQLGPLAFLLPLALFLTAVRHPRYALLSGVTTAITCLFAASYSNASIERYYLGPVFFAWTWLAVGAATLVDGTIGHWLRGSGGDEPEAGAGPARAGDTRRILGALGAVVVAITLLVPTGAAFEGRRRDADRSGETEAQAWIDDMTASLAPDAVVVSWWSYSTSLWYGQLVEGRRPDIWIVDDRTLLDLGWTDIRQVIDATLGKRPVYVLRLTTSEIAALSDTYVVTSVGRPSNLYRLTGRKEPAK